MSVNVSIPTYQDDPEYQAAMRAFHQGNFAAAIQMLEGLALRHPHVTAVKRTLEDARFKADLDAGSRVRAKRWVVNWRPLAARLAIVLALGVILWAGAYAMRNGLGPMLAQTASQQAQARLLNQAQQYLAAGEWEDARDAFTRLLGMVPEHAEAQAGLVTVAEELELRALYEQAMESMRDGDLDQALQQLSELQTRRASYADVGQQITRVRRWQEIDRLLEEATTVEMMQLYQLAGDRYQQARDLDINYRKQETAEGMVDAYLHLAGQIVNANPPTPHRLEEAIRYYDAVLTVDTRNPTALEERRVVRLYLEGKEYARLGNYHFAVSRLQAIYDIRPTYQGDLVVHLYDSLVGSGDQYMAAGDCSAAYGQYDKAARLPVEDKTVGLARMSETAACLTPTPTPSNTPLPTEPPPPSSTPTATPTPRPLDMFRGKIAFLSENPDYPESPGVWVMNPDGGGREYLGTEKDYRRQLDALREAETYSPDRLLRVYVTNLDGRAQVFMDYSAHPQYSSIGNRSLTRLTGIAYDPVWSPDGGTIAFVTQENESDDIWLMDPDGNRQRSLMRNDWEWDKHPSWSPDSSLIVFWSNRNGLSHIYVMDTNGRILRNLSNVGWDEYDPIWIK